MSDEELKSILEKKRDQIKQQRQLEKQREVEERKKEVQRQKSRILRSILSREARERLARIKMAKPRLGELVEQQLIVLGKRGAIQGQISDKRFKKLLKKMNKKRKKGEEETEIKFKRKGSSHK